MAQIVAGHRLVYRAYGIELESQRDELSVRINAAIRGRREIPEIWVCFRRKPLGDLFHVGMPRWIIQGTSLADLQLPTSRDSGDRLGGGPPLFTEVVAKKEFTIDDQLYVQWADDSRATVNRLDDCVGRAIRDELRPHAILAAGIVALRIAKGAVLDVVDEWHTFWDTDTSFLSLATSEVCEVLPVHPISKAGFFTVVEDLACGISGPERRSAALALASHWYLEGCRQARSTDKFLFNFLVLEVISWLSVSNLSSGGNVAGKPWQEREAQLKALAAAIKRSCSTEESSQLSALEQRLKERRYAEPSLTEAFEELSSLHASITAIDGRAFRELYKIRNDILHGRITEPPELIDGKSVYIVIEDLARKIFSLVISEEMTTNRESAEITIKES